MLRYNCVSASDMNQQALEPGGHKRMYKIGT
jgi:hypothetical protein